MNILINESRIPLIVKKWLTENYGKLGEQKSERFKGTTYYYDDGGEVLFYFNLSNRGNFLTVNHRVTDFLESFFSGNIEVNNRILLEWFQDTYQTSPIHSVNKTVFDLNLTDVL